MIQVTQQDINRSVLVRKRLNGNHEVYPLIEFCIDELKDARSIATAATEALSWMEKNEMLTHNAIFEVYVKNKALTSITVYCTAYLTRAMIEVLMEDSDVCPLKNSDEWTLAVTPLD